MELYDAKEAWIRGLKILFCWTVISVSEVVLAQLPIAYIREVMLIAFSLGFVAVVLWNDFEHERNLYLIEQESTL